MLRTTLGARTLRNVSQRVSRGVSTEATTKAAREAAAETRRLNEAKRRALLREDFALPLRMGRGILYVVASVGIVLGIHTMAIHAYAEHSAPTPPAFDFWTRVHLRRAWLLEKHQSDLDAAERYLARALETETGLADKGWTLWKKEYLSLVLKLAHVRLLRRRPDEAIQILQPVSDELHAKLEREMEAAVQGAATGGAIMYPEPLQRLAAIVVRLDTKLAGLHTRVGHPGVAEELAENAIDLALILNASPRDLANARLAAADALKAQPERSAEATAAYASLVADLDSASFVDTDAANLETPEVPYLEEGLPQSNPVPCVAAIGEFHLGDLLLSERRRAASSTKAEAPSSSSWFRSSPAKSTVHVPTPEDILVHFERALARAEQAPAARACGECKAATLSTLGAFFRREGDEVQAVDLFRAGLAAAQAVGDIEAESLCETQLHELGVLATPAAADEVTAEAKAESDS
ncbi:hypothetical protein H9P43_000323 [Blastocladiella emersonii ATCC 22665]|nr:hypothetical protein H9P43_000323 [Blastocladiella emersonii ATCC 22665]